MIEMLKKYKDIYNIFFLCFILGLIIILKSYNIIFYNSQINIVVISLLTLYGGYMFFTGFTSKAKAIGSLLVISVGTLMIDLFLVLNFDLPVIVGISSGFLISYLGILYILERNYLTSIKKLITIGLSYFITIIFLGHLSIIIIPIRGLYPIVEEKIYSSCIEGICIDAYKTDWKLNHFTIYSYNRTNIFIKYKQLPPDIYWGSHNEHDDYLFFQKLTNNFEFRKDKGEYILNYKNLKGELHSLIIQ